MAVGNRTQRSRTQSSFGSVIHILTKNERECFYLHFLLIIEKVNGKNKTNKQTKEMVTSGMVEVK